jgi:hypothetical protein
MPAGSTLILSVEDLLKQTDENLAKGFRAIKMKVGRPDLASDVARVQAMRKYLGDGFPLMADANMKWTVEEAIRAARAAETLRPHLARRADYSRRRCGPRSQPGIRRSCVYRKPYPELMTGWNRLSWRNDRAVLFRSGRLCLAIQVEVAA